MKKLIHKLLHAIITGIFLLVVPFGIIILLTSCMGYIWASNRIYTNQPIDTDEEAYDLESELSYIHINPTI